MQQERESAELCSNGCGFFGAPGSGGMCSVCWKKTMSNRQMETPVATPSVPESSHDVAPAADVPVSTASSSAEVAAPVVPVATVAVADAAAPAAPEVVVQKNKKRCWTCKKKIGLTGIGQCRCGFVFCSDHRYADQHDCTFDFKAADKAVLAQRNPGGGQFLKVEKL